VTPGVLIEENKRRKLLRDLGVENKIASSSLVEENKVQDELVASQSLPRTEGTV
jgi:hypothetical protein